MCGEKSKFGTCTFNVIGSPPRVRGKGEPRGFPRGLHRITPACAGKRPALPWPRRTQPDHPRVCGEKSWSSSAETCSMGSPPRVRGKVQEELIAQGADRITPACAGKRQRYNGSVVFSEDHPRVCGEKETRTWWGSEMSGSPPRVRGKVLTQSDTYWQMRITPACAGKRVIANPCSPANEDHPRVCGEKTGQQWLGDVASGSPPRVRGKEYNPNPAKRNTGITPACAGKSWRAADRERLMEDHPRVCGEKGEIPTNVRNGLGSPPRVRGKVLSVEKLLL